MYYCSQFLLNAADTTAYKKCTKLVNSSFVHLNTSTCGNQDPADSAIGTSDLLRAFLRFSHTRVYPKVSGLAAWSENCKCYSSLPPGAVVSLFCEPV